MPLSSLITRFRPPDDRYRLKYHVNNGELTWKEIRLEQSGEIGALQRYRYTVYWESAGNGKRISSRNLLETEANLRAVVQKEISLREQLKKGYVDCLQPDEATGKSIKEELKSLSTKCWLLEQEWWQHRSAFFQGCHSRAFDLWRSHPRWYMHRGLVKDCAGRKGCCARGCGCCADRQISSPSKLGVGHCTLECGCCRKARGFELTEQEKKDTNERFNVQNDNPYSSWIIRLAIWGIEHDSSENPFDLIEEPNYEKTYTKQTKSFFGKLFLRNTC